MGKTTRLKYDWTVCPDGKHGRMTTPQWWINEMMERPFRACNRMAERQIMTGYKLPEEVIFPKTHKKPHKYYW